ncbi:outer membrane lipoprotein chaperone LolA [Neiella marina]|uniref:Outer-membrane lipoprotein carrier protein n=1 Tax=Neiella holothuriorum TaxID=2870530 RepID=A0ABS7EL79_9GAMM|nr:outer membrane lipoprotein chaperone LolA [Neiella holothuriorum]MBW8192442.1 outer membrane lipoprotein chaperone LolA [Neiella holothuriorum]
MTKILKLAALAACCWLTANTATAATDNADARQALRSYLASMAGFSANFEQTVYDEQQQVLQQSSGNLATKRPGMLRWQVEIPDEELLIANGDALWLYSPFLEQVSIYSLQDAIGQSPFMLLTSDEDAVWQDYHISQNDTGYRVVPNSASNVAWLQVNVLEQRIDSILMQDSAGTVTRFQLTDFTGEAPQGNELFEFKIPEGVDIDDQRTAG